MPRVGRLAKRQQAKHIKTPIDVYINPATDDDDDEDIMYPRANHVPVLSPFAEPPTKPPQSIFDLPGPHSMVNPTLAVPYRQLVAQSCHIEIDEFYDYFRRIYRLIRQLLFDVLPVKFHYQIGVLSPKTFAIMCLVLAKVRMTYIHCQFFGVEFDFPSEIRKIELPCSVAAPINAIGCFTAGPNYSYTVPQYRNPRYGVMYAFRKCMLDDSMEKLQIFVSVAKHYKVIKTTTLSFDMGGSLWWKLDNHKHPKHIHVLRNIYSYFSNVSESDIHLASIVNPIFAHDFKKPVLRRYSLQASKKKSVRDHLAFELV